MRIGHELRRLALIGAVTFLLCAPVVAQDTGGNAGQQGGQLGRQLIDQAHAPVLNESGGRHEAGSVRIGDQELQIGELLPGATRSSMDQVKSRRDDDVRELERQGIAQYNRVAREEGSAGEAARAVFDVSTNSAGAAHPDVQWLLDQGVATDPIAESFADCEATAQFIPGDTIQSTIYSSESCTVGPGSNGGGSAVCGRGYSFEIHWPNGYNPDRPHCPPLVNDGTDIIDDRWNDRCNRYEVTWHSSGTSQCEQAAELAACQMQWECTAEGSFEIENGIFLDEDTFDRFGIPPLFPGAPNTCRAARASLACPVCVENDDGSQHSCSMVDVSGSEGSTCQALDQDASCRQVGTTCVLRDEQTGQCALTSRRYSCERPRQIDNTVVLLGNSCNAQIQCVDGSCNDLEGLDGPPGMSMQEAMARMVVTETMLTDKSYDADSIPPGDGSGQPTPEQQRAMEQIQLFRGEQLTCQRGYAGLVDCCGRTQTDAHELYWSIYQRVSRDRQAARQADEGGQSAYDLWQQGNAGYDSLSNPFTSLRDNVMGGSDRPVDAVTMTIWEEFIARAREEIRPSLSPSWMCSDSEFDLAIQREVDMCSYAGTYCSQRVLGACLKRRESYCCYNSPMSKELRASAEPGGELNHGDARRADCSGLQIDELDRINWDAIDFTRLAGNMAEGGAFDRTNDPAHAEANFTGSGQSGSMGRDRQSLGERSEDRLSSFDADDTRRSIGQDVSTMDYRVQTQAQSGPARLSFTSGTARGRSGHPIMVMIGREGSSGPASAQVTVVGGSPETAGFWQETVYWGAGDTSTHSVTLMPPAGARGQVVLELSAMEGSVSGHAQILVHVE